MSIAAKVAALLEALRPADIEALPPFTRRQLADRCRHLAALAEREPDAPKAGVLARLQDGERAQ